MSATKISSINYSIYYGYNTLTLLVIAFTIKMLVWFGALWTVFCNTRAHLTGTYCLKPIPNGYKHPCLKRDSNLPTTVPNGSTLAFGHYGVEFQTGLS